ncbi:MAG: hypothetical protein ICV60_04185 [Pyrinomonadaceae bacterium]|nr:hypothetical protein [Pyrinomonadaceae bacterium]
MPRLNSFLVLLVILLASAQSAAAQTSIFNVPTTDVLPPEKLYVEADYITKPVSYEKGGYSFFGPTIVYGLRKNVEVGINFFYTKSSDPDEAELQPNAKWQFYSNEGRGLEAAVGGIVFIPLKNRATTHPKAMLYANISKQIKGKYGPRFTTGAYGFVGRMDEGETRRGVMLGYEQPLSGKVTFVTDWFSGYNVFGYTGVGLGVDLPKDNYIFTGYSFGNRGRGNNWLGIFLAHTF